jgi:enoyl-CoA hydratase/carnithine racemase
MAREEEIYLGFSERWRNIPKPTIAEVHGKVISGGLMLAWPCDLIVAADEAEFTDNVVSTGVNAVEFFNHPYEFGFRKAKELLFTSAALSAADAERIGMVNRVVPRAELTRHDAARGSDRAAAAVCAQAGQAVGQRGPGRRRPSRGDQERLCAAPAGAQP